jgi:hypothetical protein
MKYSVRLSTIIQNTIKEPTPERRGMSDIIYGTGPLNFSTPLSLSASEAASILSMLCGWVLEEMGCSGGRAVQV